MEAFARDVAAGVPYVALAPASGADQPRPLVVAWHLHDPPRSEAAMAAALPLDGLDAWRVYLGLPMNGSRLPPGGLEEFFALGAQDAVLKIYEPVVSQAVEEFPAALAELRRRLPIAEGPVGLLGGSAGAMVAQCVLAETDLEVAAAALVSPVVQLAQLVAANERLFGITYPWTERSRAVADRLDFVARVGELTARHPRLPVLLVTGAGDDEQGILQPAEQLYERLSAAAGRSDRVAKVAIPDMAHALAEEPGLEPAPQTPHAAQVDTTVTAWFNRHLR